MATNQSKVVYNPKTGNATLFTGGEKDCGTKNIGKDLTFSRVVEMLEYNSVSTNSYATVNGHKVFFVDLSGADGDAASPANTKKMVARFRAWKKTPADWP